jgi:hypothetical protein
MVVVWFWIRAARVVLTVNERKVKYFHADHKRKVKLFHAVDFF